MKGLLILSDYVDYDDGDFSIGVSPQDFTLCVNVKDKDLEQQLKNKETFLECMQDIKDVNADLSDMGDDTSIMDRQIEFLENNFDNLLDHVEYIKFDFNEKDMWKYLKDNPILLTKKIAFDIIVDITEYDKLLKLKEEFAPLRGNAYVILSGNGDYVSLEDCFKTVSYIKAEADRIKALNLSPFETIMYVYDMVRNRVYTSENEDETAFKSRDLSQVLFGDKIVCAGYDNIFKALLKYLGFSSNTVGYADIDGPGGHARNEAYIKDDKYNIDGVYYFDPTFDCKRCEGNNTYLNHYRHFALTRNDMNKNDTDMVEERMTEFTPDFYDKMANALSSKDMLSVMKYSIVANRIFAYTNKNPMLSQNIMAYCAGKEEALDIDLFLGELKDSIEKFNKKIYAETYIKALDVVREVEYKQDSNWYPYGVDELYTVFVKSNWIFEEMHLDKSVLFLMRLFEDSEEGIMLSKEDNYVNFIRNEGLLDKQKNFGSFARRRKKEDNKNE